MLTVARQARVECELPYRGGTAAPHLLGLPSPPPPQPQRQPSPPDSRPPVLLSVPPDVFQRHVACFLPLCDVLRLGATCRGLFVALEAPPVWRELLARVFGAPVDAMAALFDTERAALLAVQQQQQHGQHGRSTLTPQQSLPPSSARVGADGGGGAASWHALCSTSPPLSPPQQQQQPALPLAAAGRASPSIAAGAVAARGRPPPLSATAISTACGRDGTLIAAECEPELSNGDSSPPSPASATASFPADVSPASASASGSGSGTDRSTHAGPPPPAPRARCCQRLHSLAAPGTWRGEAAVAPPSLPLSAGEEPRGQSDASRVEGAQRAAAGGSSSSSSSSSSWLCAPLLYPWKRLFCRLYAARVTAWLRHLQPQRTLALIAATSGDLRRAVAHLDPLIEWQLQGGLQGGLEALCTTLSRDLCLRGQLRRELAEWEGALSDFAIAARISRDNRDAHACAVELMTRDAVREKARCIAWPDFDIAAALDATLRRGTLLDRAAFAFEVQHCRGPPPFAFLMHEQLMGEELGVFSVEAMRRMRQAATHVHQKLVCDAWLALNAGDVDIAISAAELAAALLPPCASVAEEERGVAGLAARRAAARSIIEDEHAAENAELAHVLAAHGFAPAAASAAAGAPSPPLLPAPMVAADDAARRRQQLLHPDAGAVLFTLGRVARREGEVALHAHLAHLSCEPLPGCRAVVCTDIASLLLARSLPAAALPWCVEALRCSPRFFPAFRSCARALHRLGGRAAAFAVMSLALQRCKPVPAEAYSERSTYSAAPHNDLAMATRLHPRLSHPYRLRAALLMDEGRHHEAVAEITRAIAFSCAPADLALRALFELHIGNRAAAQRDMALALTLVPTSSGWHAWLRGAAAAAAAAAAAPVPATPAAASPFSTHHHHHHHFASVLSSSHPLHDGVAGVDGLPNWRQTVVDSCYPQLLTAVGASHLLCGCMPRGAAYDGGKKDDCAGRPLFSFWETGCYGCDCDCEWGCVEQ